MKKILTFLFFVFALTCYGQDYSATSGFRGFVDLGYGFRAGDEGANNVNLNIIGGYQVNKYIFTGAGIGYLGLWKGKNIMGHWATVPVFANIRAEYPVTSKVAPFAETRVGYAFCPGGENCRGFYYSGGAGIRIAPKDKFGFNIGAGYSSLNGSMNKYNSVSLKLGVDFQF